MLFFDIFNDLVDAYVATSWRRARCQNLRYCNVKRNTQKYRMLAMQDPQAK